MSETIPTLSHWNALRKIVKRLPANLAYYGSALGAIVLAGGGQLPPGLEFVAGSIGGNMLSNMISDILKDDDLLDDEIRRRAEEAIHKSDIANLLTKQDFLQGYARLIQRLDAQKIISQDILDELRTGFSKVATADQVEELKRLILQLMQQPSQTAARKVRLFISYARKDDEPFVERLYHDLKDEFDVWWDRETMSNRGKTFLQEIRDAIDWADRLLLVAGSRAFTSDYVRDEWQYAYETYKGINIALRLGDYTDFPAQLSGFDAPDFRSDADYDERLTTFKRQLTEPVAPIGTFYNVPALPPHFLNRPESLDALRELVIADVDKPTLISGEKRTTAVEGMGGIGKSVLAAAFAHDRKVRFAFPDGIVWLTAGRDAKLYELYRAVGVALNDDLSNYPDETTARQNAQKALTGKKCLLILDDVWELPVGRAFRDLISGTVTRLLITTRNLQINDLLNANEYRLDLIDRSQAADYLRSWVGDDPKLEEITEKLGYLFLALKLAGARMKKDNLSGADYLRTFDRVSRMKIDRNAIDREDSLEASITLSVDAAFAGIENKKLLYHVLGNFREDASIPQQTILELWQHLYPDLDEFELSEILTALVDLALVERNAEDRTITLHDLLLRYAREKLDNPLSDEQVAQNFQDNPSLLKVIQEAASLHAALRTPLILQIFILAYRNAPISELQTLQNLNHRSDIRDHVVKTYIDRQYQNKVYQQHSWPFRLQDVLEILGRAAMLNVVGGSYRINHKGGELSDYELNPKLFSGKFDDFIRLVKDLQLLIHAGFDKKGDERFQFPHLILRDHLAYAFSLQRLRDVGWNQDRSSHIPSPALCIGRLKDHRAVEELIAALEDKTANVRMNAAYGLGALQDARGLQPLINSLGDAEWNVRSAAVWALGRLENRYAVQAVLDKLNDESWDVRKSAVGAIASLLKREAVPQLLLLLKNDGDFRVRQEAAIALGDVGDSAAVEPLIEALAIETDSVRPYIYANQTEGHDTRKLLATRTDSVRPHIADALGRLHDVRAIDPLIELAGDSFSQLSSSSQMALRKIGVAAIMPLSHALRNDDHVISRGAALSLRYFQEAGLRILIDAISDDHVNARRNSVFALNLQAVQRHEDLMAVYGYQSRPSRSIFIDLLKGEPQYTLKLISALRSSDIEVWQDTGKLLASLGEIAIQPLIDSISNISDEDIYKGLELLSQTTNVNLETLTSFETDVRFAALVLGVLVKISQPTIKPLLNIITTSETRSAIKMLAMGALIAIGQIAESSIIEALRRINDNSMRWDLMLILEQIATEVSIPTLVSLLDVDYHPESEDQSIGDIAASILQKIGTKEALAALVNSSTDSREKPISYRLSRTTSSRR